GAGDFTDLFISGGGGRIFLLATQQVAQREGREFVVQATVLSLAPILPDAAILLLGQVQFAGSAEEIPLFEGQKIITRKAGSEGRRDLQGIIVAMVTAQKNQQNHAGIHAGFAARAVVVIEILNALILVATQSH